MNKMVVISEEQIREVREGLDRLFALIDDESLPEEVRARYFEQWRGSRHVLRSLGLKEIYSDRVNGPSELTLNPFN